MPPRAGRPGVGGIQRSPSCLRGGFMTVTRDLAVVGVGNMEVSVLGAFLSRGRRCLAVDIDTQKVAELRRGKSLVPEHGADELFVRAVRSGDLDASTDLRRVARRPVSSWASKLRPMAI